MKHSIKSIMLLAGLLVTCSLAAQSFPVTGKIVDASSGEPLIGASVLIAGTNSGVVSEPDGSFNLVLEKPATLSFSYIGYSSKDIYVDKASTLTVALSADQDYLDEVVVIGYGSVRRKDLTGSVSQITSSQIQNASVVNVMTSLEGRPGFRR